MPFNSPDNELLNAVGKPGLTNGRLVTTEGVVFVLAHLEQLVSELCQGNESIKNSYFEPWNMNAYALF